MADGLHISGETQCAIAIWKVLHGTECVLMCAKQWGEGIQTKSLYLQLPWWLVMCVVFSKTLAISLGCKAFWCPKAVLCKPWEDGFLMRLFMVVTGISYILPYLWTAIIFILVYLLSKWKGTLLLDIIQSNFLIFSRQALCLSWYLDILASVLGYKHFST